MYKNITFYFIQEVFPMNTLSQVPEKMQQILTTIADEAALETGFCKRNRKLAGSHFAQTLTFSWLENPDASYTQLTHTAASLGIPISRQAIEQRFTAEAAQTLKAILDAAASEVISADPQVLPLLEQFNGIYIQDSSWITLPDTLHDIWEGTSKKDYPNKSELKLHLRFDVATGTFEHFQLTNGITADSTVEKQIDRLPQGSLRLADLGYFSLQTLQELTDEGVFWISRYKVRCSVFDNTGKPLCLHKWLKFQTENIIETDIFIGSKKRMKVRLVAQRLSEEETEKRRRDINYRAKRKHTQASQARLQLAGWNIYITNIGTDQLTAEQICVIARIRWQIELIFKCFKSLGKVDTSRSKKPYRILCEIYAKLIAAIIRHWVMLVIGWRCLRHSLSKTVELITSYTRTITTSFRKSKRHLRETFDEIKQVFENGCYIERRANRKTTLEYLENATKNR